MSSKDNIRIHLEQIVQEVTTEFTNSKQFKSVLIRYCPDELAEMVFSGAITKQELYEIFCQIIFNA